MPEIPDSLEMRAAVEDLFTPDHTEEIEFWRGLAAQYGRAVLVALSRFPGLASGLADTGLIVTCAESSQAEFAAASARAEALSAESGRRLHMVRVDTATPLRFEDEFDFAVIGSGFAKLPGDSEREAFLGPVHDALRAGGGVGLELISASSAELQADRGEAERVIPAREAPGSVRAERVARHSYDPATRLLKVRETLVLEADGARREFESESILRAFDAEEARSLLEKSGFEEFSAYSDYKMTPYDGRASKLIVVAEKPMHSDGAKGGRKKHKRSP
jgi:hypothetical protein